MDKNSKLQDNLNDVQKSFNGMCDNLNDLITCQICLERFQSAGERIPCKLKCPHIMCRKCADDWLEKVTSHYSTLISKIIHSYLRRPVELSAQHAKLSTLRTISTQLI